MDEMSRIIIRNLYKLYDIIYITAFQNIVHDLEILA